MSRIYLPTSEQMEETLIHLGKIAGALGSKIDLSSWKGIQQAVRSGLAPELLPIGTQLTVSHGKYGNMVFDVVAHDYFKSVKNENAHTMTLLTHDCYLPIEADAREAFYYAESDLPAGTYNFTLTSKYESWEEGTYQFTLLQSLPKGGQLTISGESNVSLTALNVQSYASRIDTTVIETVAIVNGSEGIELGVFGVELNHASRVSVGSNNYKESAVRQFLNSSAEAGAVWTPQTKFDRPPSWFTSTEGFVRGFNDDFLATVGEVIIGCAANTVYESPDSSTTVGSTYDIYDKFCLASYNEIFEVNNQQLEDNTTLFPFYKNANNIDRIKYSNGDSAKAWATRTPHISNPSAFRSVDDKGNGSNRRSSYAVRHAIACTIV